MSDKKVKKEYCEVSATAMKQSIKDKKDLIRLFKSQIDVYTKAIREYERNLIKADKQLSCPHPKFEKVLRINRSGTWYEAVCTKCKFVVMLYE